MPVSSRCPQGTYFHVFQRRAKLPPQVFRKSAKNVVQKSKECPQLPHFAVIPRQRFPGPRRGFWQPSTFNCPRTRSQKRLVGTHVTVVTGPCASNQNIPSVLRKKKSVHHPGLAPVPPQLHNRIVHISLDLPWILPLQKATELEVTVPTSGQ